MKFEDILAIFIGIILGLILGFTQFDLPLSVQMWPSNVNNLMNATEVIEKHVYNCNEFYLYSLSPLEYLGSKFENKTWSELWTRIFQLKQS